MGFPTYDQVRLAPWKQLKSSIFPISDSIADTSVLAGRFSTKNVAGDAILLDSTYAYGELWELRTRVTSWTGIGDSFKAFYFRSEAGVASGGKGLRTAEFYAIANATFSIDNLQAAYFEAGMKASGTQTIKNVNAAEFSLAPYGGTGAITITNYWDCILLTPSGVSSRIDATNAAKINGIHLLARDGDGGSTKLGDGILFENDSAQSGTRTLTNGINIAIGCTTGIKLAGACTTGISLSGASTNSIVVSGATQKGIGVTMAALAVGDNYSGVRVAVTGAAPHNEYGMAAYFDTTITGTTAGHCYGVGSWINTATTPVLTAGHIIVPFEGGVYTGEAQASARIVFAGQYQAILNGAPASLHAWRLNTTQTTTALIAAANTGSVGYVAGAGTSGTQLGYIPLADIVGVNSGNPVYVRVYATAT